MVRTAAKIDLKHELGDLYKARSQPMLVEVPELSFLMIDGDGDPAGPAFQEAVDALYATAYGLKFRVRALDGADYRVMPLEGLWWIPNARVWDFEDKSDWDWTLMIVQPEMVTPELAREVTTAVRAKRASPALEHVRLEAYEEGLSVQTMHVGPWEAERPTLERLQMYIAGSDLVPVGKHHEIYLSDPGRVEPDRMRTIVRQPVVRRT
jgi:hypothetical protein